MSDDGMAREPEPGGKLVGVAEVSLQVPNGKTATSFPLPLWVKKVMIFKAIGDIV